MSKPVIKVVAALILNEKNEILITQRHQNTHLGGYWEFPGGRVEEDETYNEALTREITEEVDLKIDVGNLFWQETEEYDTRIIDISFYLCQLNPIMQQVRELDVADHRWIQVEQLDQFTFPKADLNLIRKLSTLEADLQSPE